MYPKLLNAVSYLKGWTRSLTSLVPALAFVLSLYPISAMAVDDNLQYADPQANATQAAPDSSDEFSHDKDTDYDAQRSDYHMGDFSDSILIEQDPDTGDSIIQITPSGD